MKKTKKRDSKKGGRDSQKRGKERGDGSAASIRHLMSADLARQHHIMWFPKCLLSRLKLSCDVIQLLTLPAFLWGFLAGEDHITWLMVAEWKKGMRQAGRIGNAKSARSFSDRSFFVNVCAARPCQMLVFPEFGGLTEVFGRMSAGISGRKLPLWADFSFLREGSRMIEARGGTAAKEQQRTMTSIEGKAKRMKTGTRRQEPRGTAAIVATRRSQRLAQTGPRGSMQPEQGGLRQQFPDNYQGSVSE